MENKDINQNEKLSGSEEMSRKSQNDIKFDIEKSYKGDDVILYLKGRIDTQTAPEFQSYIDDYFDEGVEDLILDFSEVEYLSSAGLRTILYIQKKMKSLGEEHEFLIINVNEAVMEIFDMIGFTDIINISRSLDK